MKALFYALLIAPWGAADYLQTLPWEIHLTSVVVWMGALIATGSKAYPHGR